MADAEYAKLKWRCRRGMKELDQLMLRYLNLYYQDATKAEKDAFIALLDMEEPQLLDLLNGKTKAVNEHRANVIKRIQSSPAVNFS